MNDQHLISTTIIVVITLLVLILIFYDKIIEFLESL